MGIFSDFEAEKALKEVIDMRDGKGSWEEWENRWPASVKEKVENDIKIVELLGWVKR